MLQYPPDIGQAIFFGAKETSFTNMLLLALQISYDLNWREQVDIMCLKASRKLSVLQRVKNLQRNTLDLLCIRSVID